MSLVVILNGVVWTTGVPDYDLADAVERGAARVEERSVGEENEDVVRKSIQLQRDSLSFWKVITLVGDFLVEPLWIGFAGVFGSGGVERCGGDQWPAGPVSGRHAGMCGLARCVGVGAGGPRRPDVGVASIRRSTRRSCCCCPHACTRRANGSSLQQIDCFALIGWLGIAWGACRRGQTSLLAALLTCLLVAVAGGSDHCRHILADQSGHAVGVVSRVGRPRLKLGHDAGKYSPLGTHRITR